MKRPAALKLWLTVAAMTVNASGIIAQTVAHRGVFAIKGYEHAENTIDAIKLAYDRGYRTVEIDVRATSDGQGVLMHDNCPISPNSGCFGPGRTTNDDNNGGNYTPLYAPNGGTKGTMNRTPQGRTYNQMQSNYKFSKVYDVFGNILYDTTQPGVTRGWGLADLIWYRQNSTDSDAYKIKNMYLVLDIQSPAALAAAQGAVAQYNAWSNITFKCWTTAFSVDNNQNLVGTFYGEFAYSLNPYTIQLSSDGNTITGYQVTSGGSLIYISAAQFNALLSKLSQHAGLGPNESFVASNNQYNANDAYIYRATDANPNKFQYGVVRYPDVYYGANDFSTNTDTLTLINPNYAESQQNFGKQHSQPITDIQQ